MSSVRSNKVSENKPRFSGLTKHIRYKERTNKIKAKIRAYYSKNVDFCLVYSPTRRSNKGDI